MYCRAKPQTFGKQLQRLPEPEKLLPSATPWEQSGVIIFTRLGRSLLFKSRHCAPSAGVCWGWLSPWTLRYQAVPHLSPLISVAPSPSWAESLSHEPRSVLFHQGWKNEGLCGGRGARLRAGTPAKVLVLPPKLPGSMWMKPSIQLPLILKFCDFLKCTLGMTASISIKLQFESFTAICQS